MRIGEKSFPLTECNAEVKAIECERPAKAGGYEYVIIDQLYRLIICSDREDKRCTDYDFLKDVDEYGIQINAINRKGQDERTLFRNIQPVRLELNGEWIFRLNEKDGEKLTRMLKG